MSKSEEKNFANTTMSIFLLCYAIIALFSQLLLPNGLILQKILKKYQKRRQKIWDEKIKRQESISMAVYDLTKTFLEQYGEMIDNKELKKKFIKVGTILDEKKD